MITQDFLLHCIAFFWACLVAWAIIKGLDL